MGMRSSVVTMYSIYQLLNPCEPSSLLELAAMQCRSFYAKLPGSLSYFTGRCFSIKFDVFGQNFWFSDWPLIAREETYDCLLDRIEWDSDAE